ncbi:MAG: lysophospholipid acyltransferase family protein [Myxococcales bacterium]|nr:lysophospholipid acyltransferase family protein [Myxococcales bacterium]
MMALARWVGVFLGWFVGDLLRIRRSHVEACMRRAGVALPRATAREMYRGLGTSLMELFLSRRAVKNVSLDQRVLDVLAARGAVIATAHTGAFDLVACAAAERVPLTVVTKHLSIGVLDRVWQTLRRRHGLKTVAAGSAAVSAGALLRRGEAVAMLIDQAPERERATTVVTFLGQPARVDLAPALIAARARVPLCVVFARRTSSGRHVAELAGVLEPPAHAGPAWAETAMRQASAWLEAFVLRHPDQWLWMHRRWKDAPPASDRRPSREITLEAH